MCLHVSMVVPQRLHFVSVDFLYLAIHSQVGIQFDLRSIASMVSPLVKVAACTQELHSLYFIHVVEPIP